MPGFLGPLLGAVAGPVVGGLLGSIGGRRAEGQERQAATAAQEAAYPLSVFGPSGSATFNPASQSYNLELDPDYKSFAHQTKTIGRGLLREFAHYPYERVVSDELSRLRKARAPSIDSARARLQSQLLNRGRLGLGVGGGLQGNAYQPEIAAQEEAILRSQLGDIDYANQQARGRRDELLTQGSGLLSMYTGFKGGANNLANIGIAGRLPQGIAALQAQPGMNAAGSTRGFFSSLGTTLGGAVSELDFDGFGGGSDTGGYSEGTYT